MTDNSKAVATVEPAAVPYVLRSPTAAILNRPEARAQIAPFIPRGVDFDHVILEVQRVATNNPAILKCAPESIIQAVGQAVQTGLVIGKTIHLVPIQGKLNAWPDYKGDIELVVRSGAARHIEPAAVYKNDVFDYELGDSPFVKHKPILDSKKRGPIIGGYCVAYLNSTGTLKKIVVMSIDQIEAIRAKSRSWNPKEHPECPDWYVEKTCVHRVCKTLPKDPRLARVLAMINAREAYDVGEEIEDATTATALMDAVGFTKTVPAAEWEPSTPVEPPAPVISEAEHYRLPFGRTLKGKMLAELTSQQIADGIGWAREQQPTTELDAFMAAAEQVLEERRLGGAS